jgi:1,4-dihydroxy-2-naphthoate octaprenyltransferase
MSQTIEQIQDSRRSLLRHFAIMLVSCVALQTVIAVRGNHIDVVSQLLLGCVALYYGWYHYSSRDQLRRLRFGRLVAHVVGYLIVNLSFHIHAFILIVSSNPAIKGTADFTIDQGWFGVLFGMTTFWGLGLLTHLTASIAKRGFEELPRG